MTKEDVEDAANSMKVLANIMLVCDGENASVIMTALQVAMMMVIYNVNKGDIDECMIDLDEINEYMKDQIDVAGKIDLGEFNVDTSRNAKH